MGRNDCAPKTLRPNIAPHSILLILFYFFYLGRNGAQKSKKLAVEKRIKKKLSRKNSQRVKNIAHRAPLRPKASPRGQKRLILATSKRTAKIKAPRHSGPKITNRSNEDIGFPFAFLLALTFDPHLLINQQHVQKRIRNG